MPDPALIPGDILLTRSSGWVGRAIRAATRARGEAPTVVNHVALVVAPAAPGDDPFGGAIIVEARSRVLRHTVSAGYAGRGDAIMVARPRTLSAEEIGLLVAAAEAEAGSRYGYGMLLAAGADWVAGRVLFRSRSPQWFRRLARRGRPVCSTLLGRQAPVIAAFAAAEKDFGVAGYAATPDDVHDFVAMTRHYSVERELLPWPLDDAVELDPVR